MTIENTINTYQIDGQGKRLGRIATEAASILLGKNTVNFTRHIAPNVNVKIINAKLLDISNKKSGEEYQSYSGYPGGRKVETLDHLGNRLGYSEVLRRSIAGMLPNNKLKAIRLKSLIITE